MPLTHEYNLTETDIENRLGESVAFESEQIFEIKAVYRNKGGQGWKLCSALIQMVDVGKDAFSQEYNEDAFFTVYKTYSSISEVLFCLFETGIEIYETYPPIIINEKTHWEEYLIPSILSHKKIPIRHYLYRLDSCNFVDEKLVGFKLPHYSSFNEKLKEFIPYEKFDANQIHFLIEDKRAFLEVNDEIVTVNSTGDIHLSGCLDRSGEKQDINSENIKVDNINLNGLTSVELWLINEDSLILDYISSSEYKYGYQLEKEEVSFKELIKEKIKNGETLNCEFKMFIDLYKGDSKADELDKTVCAFSNTEGGFLIVGVSDNGEVLGLDEDVRKKYKAPLDESINLYLNDISKRLYENLTINNCFTIDILKLFSKKLIVITVNKVKSWNFLQVTDIPYARKGSTSYKATHLVALEFENSTRINDSNK